MRKLVVIEFLTLDGVMQGLGSPEEDRDGGFEYGGWGAPYADDIQPGQGEDGLGGTTAYLFGRRTYEKMQAFWPYQPDTNPIAAHMNATTKYVASRSMTEFGWEHTLALPGDLAGAVEGLKEDGDGHIAVLGSGVLVEQLLGAGLVDELQLFIHPLLLGAGKKLFGGLAEPATLELTHVSSTAKGSIDVRYALKTEKKGTTTA
jgi:dihydrofolate reductase